MKLVIIGAGPGGYTAAFEAASLGWDVTMIEKQHIGGTCLNCGCIPTKSMRASADALVMARRMTEYAVSACENPVINGPALQARKNRIIATLAGGLEKSCARLNIRYMAGTATIHGPRLVRVATPNGDEALECDAIIVATGSQALNLPGLEADHQNILDSSDALNLEQVPKSIIIVGGGVIGCELACIYHDFGSQITVIEGQDRLLPMPGTDLETSSFLAREMKKRKIRVYTGCTLQDVKTANGHCDGMIAPSPFVDAASAGVKQPAAVEAEKIFVTIGRRPDSQGLGLEQAQIKTDRRGWIEVDANLQTSVPGIYAVGDILGPGHVMLAHVAAMEGINVVDRLAGHDRPMDYMAVPSAIFTDPELASVGLSEQQARESYANVTCGVVQMRELGKAQAMGQLPGFCKIVANAESGQILGIHMAGAHSSDMIAEATLAMAEKVSIYELAYVTHAHPTLSEIIFECARVTLRAIKN